MQARAPTMQEVRNEIAARRSSRRQDRASIEDPARRDRGRRDDTATFITVSLAATGGLLVAMRTEAIGAQMQMPAQTGPLGFPTEYIQIDPDDRVLIWSAQPEMGEGTKTSLPMIVAEELDADWTRVRIDDAPMDPQVRRTGRRRQRCDPLGLGRLRRVGATARALLDRRGRRRMGRARSRMRHRRARRSPCAPASAKPASARWRPAPRR